MKKFLILIVMFIFVCFCLILNLSEYGFDRAFVVIEDVTTNGSNISIKIRINTPDKHQKLILSSRLSDVIYISGFRPLERQNTVRDGKKRLVVISNNKPFDFNIEGKYFLTQSDGIEIDLGEYGKKKFMKNDDIFLSVYLVPFKRSILDSDEFEASEPFYFDGQNYERHK